MEHVNLIYPNII